MKNEVVLSRVEIDILYEVFGRIRQEREPGLWFIEVTPDDLMFLRGLMCRMGDALR